MGNRQTSDEYENIDGNYYQFILQSHLPDEYLQDKDKLNYILDTYKALKMEGDRSFPDDQIIANTQRYVDGTAGLDLTTMEWDWVERYSQFIFSKYDGCSRFWPYLKDKKVLRWQETTKEDNDRMEGIFIDNTLKHLGMDVDYGFCAKVINRFRTLGSSFVFEYLKASDIEKIFFDRFLRDSPRVNHLYESCNDYRKAFLASMAIHWGEHANTDYLVRTFNALKDEDESEVPYEMIVDDYQSSLESLKRIYPLIYQPKEARDQMDKKFIQSTLSLYPDKMNHEVCAEMFNRLRDRYQSVSTTKVTVNEVEEIFFEAFHVNTPSVPHFLDKANDFQKEFVSCVAKYFGSDADLPYTVTVFNGLALDETEKYSPDSLSRTYRESMETLKRETNGIEHFNDQAILDEMIVFIELTKEHFKEELDYKFIAEVINSFHAPDEYCRINDSGHYYPIQKALDPAYLSIF